MFVDRIRQVFERYNYHSGSQMNQQNLYNFLSQLTPGQAYDREVADELWEQASQGSNYVDINSICRTISEGISILQLKLDQLNQEIRSLEKDKVQAYSSTNSRGLASEIDSRIFELHQDREGFEEDLRLVTLPFGINLMARNSQYIRYDKVGGNNNSMNMGMAMGGGILNQSMASNRSGINANSEELSYILYLTLAFCLCELITIYVKYDFVNLIVVTSLLSIYLLNHFDNIYIKFTLVLITISQVLEIIWLFIYAGQFWNPPQVGNYPGFMAQYLKISVVLTIVVIGLKIPIAYFLYKMKNINDAQYNISIGTWKLILDANKSNPVTRNLASVVNPQ